jgi:uncharacterized protein (TIGR02145 family)
MRKASAISVSILIALSLLLSKQASAQAPQKMSYQAVVRTAGSQLVTNKTVGMRISILQGSASGTVAYTENQTPTTNANGLLSVEIGGTGFNTIDWTAGTYFIKTEIDPAGGTNYTIIGTSQLLSVPYALFAKSAGNGFSGSYTDLTNKPALFDGNWTSLIGKPTTIAGYGITDAVSTTGIQTITGNKTFNGTVSIKKPLSNTNAANKIYVDSLIIKVMNSFAKSDETFTSPTAGTIKDIDGNTYHIIKIGSQWWTVENLRVAHYRDGSYIPKVTDNTAWATMSTGARCFYNNDSITYSAIYGAFYNWYSVADSRNLCPVGWHVPADIEWAALSTYLGGNSIAGGKIKETGTTHWTSPNTGATNESGLTILAGGYRTSNFTGMGLYGDYWTSTSFSSSNAWYIGLIYNTSTIGTSNFMKALGIPVRCIRD